MARPTLVSLAKELGVSRQTVSNVINAPHLVREETRERVAAAIEASGYQPNQAAQSLRNQKSRTIAMRIYPTLEEGINGAVMDRFLHCMVDELRTAGYHLLLVTADDVDDELETITAMHLRGRIDGCILTHSHADDPRPAQLAEAGVEIACFGRPWGAEETSTHAWVDVDGGAGTLVATRHLLDQGHHRIGFIGWPVGSGAGDDRRKGWAQAMRAAGVEGFEQWTTEGIDTMDSGLAGMEQLLAAGVEAAVCSSDSLALGAVEALRRSGRLDEGSAPVIGFDDTPVARAMGLPSIDQNVEQAARLLCQQLLRRLDGDHNPVPVTERLVTPSLAVRGLRAMVLAGAKT
ncbi:LacI family DNA-binding transcriptional regulator [Luteococcus sediminum]